MGNYFIKSGYRINERPRVYRDSLEDAQVFQLPVYERAGELARSLSVASVLDIGCGLGTKLVELVEPHCESVTGLDLPDTIEACRALHDVGHWIEGDLEDPAFSLADKYDLIVAADVVEHLVDPDRLLEVIRLASHPATRVVLSTPERDLRRGPDDMGPPGNGAHVREWNREELCSYLKDRGFVIQESRVVDLREGMKTCHLVVGAFSPDFA